MIKEKYPQLSEKAIKIFLPFPTTDMYEVKFASYTSRKTTCYNKFSVNADELIQIFSIKPDIKNI